jgi:hypothetical protein
MPSLRAVGAAIQSRFTWYFCFMSTILDCRPCRARMGLSPYTVTQAGNMFPETPATPSLAMTVA